MKASEARILTMHVKLPSTILKKIYKEIEFAAVQGKNNINFSLYENSQNVIEKIVDELEDNGYKVTSNPRIESKIHNISW